MCKIRKKKKFKKSNLSFKNRFSVGKTLHYLRVVFIKIVKNFSQPTFANKTVFYCLTTFQMVEFFDRSLQNLNRFSQVLGLPNSFI